MTLCTSWRTGRLAACACLIAGAWFAAPAHAALGDTATAIAGASTQSIAAGAARVITYVDAGGTTINEYVATSNNEIFAYTWQGPTMPNLSALLGAYDASFRRGAAAALAAQRSDLRNGRVEQPDVVVQTGGHMRSYLGRAWLPAALPVGVSQGDLQ